MSNNTVWEYVIILSGLVVRRSGMEPMVLGSIPATKPVFFPSFFFRCWLIHSFFTAIYSTKLKQQPYKLTDCLCPTVLWSCSWRARGLGGSNLSKWIFVFFFIRPLFFGLLFLFLFLILNLLWALWGIARSVFKKSVNFHPPRVSKWWTIIWLGIWLKTLVSICDVQTKPSFFLDFGIHHTCSFPPLHFSHFFYCNIFYKTRPVATCSHRLPFIQSWSLLLAYLFITDLWFCHLL